MNCWYKFHFAIGLITDLMKIYLLLRIYNSVFLKDFIPFGVFLTCIAVSILKLATQFSRVYIHLLIRTILN